MTVAIVDLYSKRNPPEGGEAKSVASVSLAVRALQMVEAAVSAVAPEWALHRQQARAGLQILNSGYSRHGASKTRKALLGWMHGGGSTDEDVTENLVTLRERSRDLYMGTPLATGALKTLRTNIVGPGLRLNAQVGAEQLGLTPDEAEAWEANVEREFGLWADTQACDAARTNTFGQLQALALLSAMMSGDCFAVLPIIPRRGSVYDLRVQILEADRVCDPPATTSGLGRLTSYGGVELGEFGEPVAYWVARYHPGSGQTVGGVSTYVTVGGQMVQNEWKKVLAFGSRSGRRNILHLLEQERPEQRRGTPILAPVVESLKQLGRYTDAELMAAVVSGFFTAFVKSAAPDTPLDQAYSTDELVDSADENSIELGNGLVVGLAPGEDVSIANPGRPNTAFDGFVVSVLRQVGGALEVPYELIVKNFVSSYSASRAALLEAWKMFRTRRAWLAASFCQPIYEEWLSEAVAKGRVIAPGFFGDPAIRAAWSAAEWYGPTQGQLDPRAEVEAAVIRVEQGFSTRARETAELTGSDWDRLHRVRVREEQKRRTDGLAAGPVSAPSTAPPAFPREPDEDDEPSGSQESP